MKIKLNKYRIFHLVVIVYLLLAFSWWSILLFKKTKEIYHLKQELNTIAPTMQEDLLLKDYRSQRNMIIGEGLVFGITILLGLLLINRAFWSEINANRKLNNFLLSITHELKTPISSIQLINHTLLKKELDRDLQKDWLQSAYNESIRLESLVNNILAVAQLDQSYNYNFEQIRLAELVSERIRRFEKRYTGREIHLENVEAEMIEADREALIKLVDNLLDNALKYSYDNTVVKIILRTEGENIYMEICDEGQGINKEEQSRIFEKFYRPGDEETRQKSGTGLGLFIVNEIVKAHNGSLKVKANQPAGTIFEIRLPKLQK